MIRIIARFHVKPGHRGELFAGLADNIPRTRAEEGCVEFEVYVDAADDEVVWLVEAWGSEAALGWHYEQPYAKAILDRLEDWLVEPPTLVRAVPFPLP